MYRATVRTIIKLYEQMCDRRYQKFWDQKVLEDLELGMHFVIEVSCDNYGYEQDGNTHHKDWERHYRRYVHVLIHKHHRIYVAEADRARGQVNALLKANEFRNIGNHDSCYGSSLETLISELYFRAHRECWAHVPQPHSRPPIMSDIQVVLESTFNPLIAFVLLKRQQIEDIEESNHGYLDRLISVEPLTAKLGI